MIKAVLVKDKGHYALFTNVINIGGNYVGGDLVAQGKDESLDFLKALELGERYGLRSTEIFVREMTEQEAEYFNRTGALKQDGV